MKTVQCPNCGASATNFKNCEFCGSLFVRAELVGYNATKLFENNEIDIVFEGLKEAIDQNIAYQAKFKGTAGQIGTNIFKNKVLFEADITNYFFGFWNRDYETDSLRGEVSIAFEVALLSEKQKLLFSQLDEFKLIDDIDANGLWQLHFGNDTRGAAYLISKILNIVFQIDFSEQLYYNHQVYSDKPPYNDLLKTCNENQTEKKTKGNCFIATAAMGSYDHSVVMDLRIFRDNWLLKRKWGVRFTNWYYTHGPKAAKIIEKSIILKKITFLLIVKPLQIITSKFR
jgi:hypothetical protein